MRPIDADEIIKYCTDKTSMEFIEFMTCIDEMPTLEVEEVRHGAWIAKNIGATSTLFICSNCQREVEAMNDYFGKPTEHMAAIYPYCHCGTKMNRQ